MTTCVERPVVKEGFHVQQMFLGWCPTTVMLSVDHPFGADDLGNADQAFRQQSTETVHVQPEAVLDALQNIALQPDASLDHKREFVEAAASSARPGMARETVDQLAGACHDAAFYRWASCVYGQDGDEQAAIRHARLVVATALGDADAWFILGSQFSKARPAAEAEFCFRRSEELGERHE